MSEHLNSPSAVLHKQGNKLRKHEPEGKVLFVSSSISDAGTFESVISKLKEKNIKVAVIVDEEKSADFMKKHSILFTNLRHYKTKNIKRILGMENPDIVVVGSHNDSLAMLFVMAAKSKGIPSIAVPHGGDTINKRTKEFFALIYTVALPLAIKRYLSYTIASGSFYSLLKIVLRKMFIDPSAGDTGCTKICVMAEGEKSRLIKQGIGASRIIVTGQPRFDSLSRVQGNKKEEIRARFTPSPETKLVLLTTQHHVENKAWTKQQRQTFVQYIIEAVEELPQCQLVIKTHPKESLSDYRTILNNLGKGTIPLLKDEYPIAELLFACDLLMTVSSTTALEAIILGKPVVTVNIVKALVVFPYVETGAAIGVSQKYELAPAIKKALYDPQYRQELARGRERLLSQMLKQDGKATDRVADLIIQTIKESQS